MKNGKSVCAINFIQFSTAKEVPGVLFFFFLDFCFFFYVKTFAKESQSSDLCLRGFNINNSIPRALHIARRN